MKETRRCDICRKDKLLIEFSRRSGNSYLGLTQNCQSCKDKKNKSLQKRKQRKEAESNG